MGALAVPQWSKELLLRILHSAQNAMWYLAAPSSSWPIDILTDQLVYIWVGFLSLDWL